MITKIKLLFLLLLQNVGKNLYFFAQYFFTLSYNFVSLCLIITFNAIKGFTLLTIFLLKYTVYGLHNIILHTFKSIAYVYKIANIIYTYTLFLSYKTLYKITALLVYATYKIITLLLITLTKLPLWFVTIIKQVFTALIFKAPYCVGLWLYWSYTSIYESLAYKYNNNAYYRSNISVRTISKQTLLLIYKTQAFIKVIYKNIIKLYNTAKNTALFVTKYLRITLKLFLRSVKNTVLLIKNMFVLVGITAKLIYETSVQLFSVNFWLNVLQQSKKVLNQLPYATKQILSNTIYEIYKIILFIKSILVAFILFIIFDIIKILNIINFSKKHKFTSVATVVFVGFIATYTVFLFNNINNYKQLNSKLGSYVALATPKIITNILNSEMFKPVRVYQSTLALEGKTLQQALLQENVDQTELDKLTPILKQYNIPKTIPNNWLINVVFQYSKKSQINSIKKLILPIDASYDLVITNTNNFYKSSQQPKRLTKYITKRKIKISKGILSSFANANVPIYIAKESARLLSWDLDLQRDVKNNDTIEIVYDCLYNQNNEMVSCNNVMYLSFNGSKTSFTQYYYKGEYYRYNGESSAKILMLTPVKETRVSSFFGNRIHPILGYSIAHKGVDFAAPIGTPVYASGKGKIIRIQYVHGYGNYIKIQHNNRISTAYAHLNAFAKGLKRGDIVDQWQLIGYVGRTGNVTGPHLHYEILINNRQVNPLSVRTGAQFKLTGQELRNFNLYKTGLQQYVSKIPNNKSTDIYFNPPIETNIFNVSYN